MPLGLESRFGPGQKRANRTGRYFERFSDLVIRMARVSQHQHLPVAFGQSRQRRANPCGPRAIRSDHLSRIGCAFIDPGLAADYQKLLEMWGYEPYLAQGVFEALQAAAALPDEQRQQVAEAIVRLTDVQLALAASTSPRASLATRASLEASSAAAETARTQALQLAGVQPPAKTATLAAPTATDLPTVEAHIDPTETSSVVPTLTVTSSLPTATVTARPNLPAVKPTDKPTNTPRPPNTPPGQIKTPNTPPGQEKTPKPDQPPPGQEKTPKPKK